MANIPDINVDIADSIVIDASTGNVVISAESQSPTVVVETATADVNVELVSGASVNIAGPQAVIVDASVSNPTIEVTVTGGGTATDNKTFNDIPIVVNVPSGRGQYTLDTGKQAFLLGYTATVAGIRIRGYVNNVHRDFDVNRPLNQDPLMNGGVLFELVTQIGTYHFSLAVPLYSETVMPLLVEHVAGVPINTTVTLLCYN